MGLDLSDKHGHFHVQRGDGRKLAVGKVALTRDELTKLFTQWSGCRLVIEASCQSAWIGLLAQQCCMELLVANPRNVELLSKSDRKTDDTDAELLTEIGRTNPKLLGPITHRSMETQEHLAILRARDELVRNRTMLVNHVRGVLKTHGVRVPSMSPECFGRRVLDSIPSELTAALQPLVRVIDAVNLEIKGCDKAIVTLGEEHYPIVKLLQQIAGVGPVVSLAFVLIIADPKRFRSSRDVAAYLGLVPRKQSSGKRDPQLHITKAGDRNVRRLLVLAANYILGRFGPDCDLRRFGLKIVGEGTDKIAKKKARVAVARKLAVLMHHLWRTGEVYDPLYLAKKRGELLAA
jgi:transposase